MHSPWYGLFESASHQTQNPSGPSDGLKAPVLLKITCSELFAAETLGTTNSAAQAATARTTRSGESPDIRISPLLPQKAGSGPVSRPAKDRTPVSTRRARIRFGRGRRPTAKRAPRQARPQRPERRLGAACGRTDQQQPQPREQARGWARTEQS